jgi:uncharacterized protein (TIGR02118 family)
MFWMLKRRAGLDRREAVRQVTAGMSDLTGGRARRGLIRLVACENLSRDVGDSAAFDLVLEAWLATEEANTSWPARISGLIEAGLAQCIDTSSRLTLTVDELPLRGADYLATRLAQPAPPAVVKVLHFSRRAPGLTLAEFSRRWRTHHGPMAGQVLPADVRGYAYVQNHRRASAGNDPPFDGVAEIYLQDAEHYARRVAWFASQEAAELNSDEVNFATKEGRVVLLVDEKIVV